MIRSLLAQAGGLRFPESPVKRGFIGPGDDCAQFDGWLCTLDMSVEGSHFRLDWSSPEEAVEKCLLSNFSDINAMGGTSKLAFLGLCLNQAWSKEVRERVVAAFAQGLSSRGVALLGGDTVAGSNGAFSVTLLGTSEHAPLRRNAARPGQDIWLSGNLGRSAGGLYLLQQGVLHGKEAWEKELLCLHRVPEVPLDLGPRLAALPGIGACIDISDGLSSELNHLALQSGVCLRVEEALLPVASSVLELCQSYKLSPRPLVLNGGEEYSLLFTCDRSESIILSSLLCKGELHRIGSVVPGQGVELLNADGKLEILKAGAWSHL